MILSHALPIPPESLFFSDSEPRHTRPQVPSHLPSFPFLFDSLFPSLPFSPAHVCGGFRLQDSRSRFSPRSTDLWLQASPLDLPVPASTPLFLSLLSVVHEASAVGPIYVFHLPRRFRAHFFHITCHGRRARLNGHGVSSVSPMSYRSRPSQPLQRSRPFPLTLTS